MDGQDDPVFLKLAEILSNKTKKNDAMVSKLKNIELDLDKFKIRLYFQDDIRPLIIHFDTPSRRFYFAVITLVVSEMQKLGRSEFIHLRKHEKTLKLLDSSLSGKYASKETESMWGKIRKTWRYNIADLEEATHFSIEDRIKVAPYEKGGKYRYECSDMECDIWANLFGYDENNKWRFKFAIESVSISLNDVSLILGDLRDNLAWKEFVKRLSVQPKAVTREKRAVPRWWKKAAFLLVAVSIVVAVTLAIWNFYLRPAPTVKVASVEKMAFPLPHKPSKVASVEKMAFPLPHKPSIAVLPFANLSGDSSQDYFSDGITENIITALSNVSNLFVIARNSTFTYKGKPVKVQQVAEELGVRCVLEGSVQRSENRVRISAQLIDALTGHHLWAENYEREFGDIFALQDDITENVTMALQVKLTEGEQARIRRRYIENKEAYEYFLRGKEILRTFTKEAGVQARKLFEKTAELEPNSAIGWCSIGWTHYREGRFGWTDTPDKSLALAEVLAQKALVLDDSMADTYSLLSLVYMARKQHEKAVAYGEKALALAPNLSDNLANTAVIFFYSGRPEEAIELIKKAMRLSPYYPSWYVPILGLAYRLTGQYKEAIAALEGFRVRKDSGMLPHIFLAFTYVEAGRMEDAQASVAEALKQNPKASIKGYAATIPYKDPVEIERVKDSLRKAGLPE